MQLSKIFVSKDVSDTKLVRTICERFAHIPIEVIKDTKALYDFITSSDDPIATGKRVLFLTKNQGAFIRKCPGTRSYICCGYQIIHIGTFCTMDCSYCILQAYFHPPVLSFFVNIKQLFIDLKNIVRDRTPELHRMGTGEFTDSLIWEEMTGISKQLISFFSKQNHAVLELKTKTTNIESLISLAHNRKTILAWSLNTPKNIQTEERRTSTLDARLKAAAICESCGFPLAFHFDPIVYYDGCEQAYKAVIDNLFNHISPENVVWISMGTFRFMPELKTVIQKRFKKSTIIYGEQFPGLDEKIRYFKPLRIKVYQSLVDHIRKWAPNVCVYFCMEDEEVWFKTQGFVPDDFGGLPHMLDKRAQQICDIQL
ncbi:spore photoproduct lyase [Candidatus Magnetomorum sp. HK-1]|nr:spore photoproduct lyase [Candidatus Magnetomorum sp. HK-1]